MSEAQAAFISIILLLALVFIGMMAYIATEPDED